jgi:hypothetical protein
MKLPNTLLRFFEKQDYAESFIAGQARFGRLDYYKTIEDSRRDEAEGTAAFDWSSNNPVHYEGVSLNGHLVLCTTHPEVDRSVLIGRWKSPYIVQINDPMALLQRINAVWHADPRASGLCAIYPVEYNKGEALEPTPSLIPPANYSYCQKPRIPFEIEREFRFVLTCKVDADRVSENQDQHVCLTLPDCRDICEKDY